MSAFSSGPQTSVAYFPDEGINGMIADTGFRHVVTGLCDEEMDFGLGVVLGANGSQSIKLPDNTGEVSGKFKGFLVYKAMIEPKDPHFEANDAASVLRRGQIWIRVQGDVVDEGPVYVIHSGASAGRVRGDASSGGTAATQVSAAKVIQGASAEGLALIEVNLP